MDWQKLLSSKRIIIPSEFHREAVPDARSEFERDFSRILYSNAFRRLHNKTQLFPMPANDHVHSRLTHSLEVSDVGWALGRLCGQRIIEKYPILRNVDIQATDFGNIVASACLAHDIGNPPFGHKGEDAIASFFRSVEAINYVNLLSDHQTADLQGFEGNAQGLRIISRISERVNRGGMRLTAATVGAFSKYPQCSTSVKPEATETKVDRKFGIFSTELDYFREVANELGLIELETNSWCRHPLAFLMEAADDICYNILDLEDGFILKLVSYESFRDVIQPIAQIESRKLDESSSYSEKVGHLRAKAIGRLVGEVIRIFSDQESAILQGERKHNLIEDSALKKEIKAIKDITRSTCYASPIVVKTEIAGYRVLKTVLSELLTALFREDGNAGIWVVDRPPGAASPIDKIMWATDYVSCMTDRYAITTYRHLLGITLPADE